MAALPQPPWPAAMAVSGGADSVALMRLLAAWAKARNRTAPVVLTVDHGLYNGSQEVARTVVDQARQWGLEGFVLDWRGPKPKANLEAAARTARYALLGSWCHRHGIAGLYLGHTREDQAETLLLRLGRGSGVDGLAAMPALGGFPGPQAPGLAVVRPLLSLPRAALRAMLQAEAVHWHEDPMNADPRFARVRLRQAWPLLIEAGLLPERLADAAGHQARARLALESATADFLARHGRLAPGQALLDRQALMGVPEEIGLRALAAVLMTVSGHTYRPRFDRLLRLYDSIRSGELGAGRTLLGCRVSPAPRAKQCFGAHSLLVRGEAPRRRREHKTASRKGPPTVDSGSSGPNMGD